MWKASRTTIPDVDHNDGALQAANLYVLGLGCGVERFLWADTNRQGEPAKFCY